ncbi:unnamed protein product [Caenorhabditis auriculariae]|uniref:F-box domain-containing protein n=1 Tax=Caenorhabditis auriculariae TaxID=2777116 RepID=A0A8S1HLR4_9PELO|nr:unnamed protein product [Caenorhabditis auriculariae]
MNSCTPNPTRCRCPRVPIYQLPDEVIEMILSHITPTELVAYGWDRVSSSFAAAIHRNLCSKTYFSFKDDIIWKFFRNGSKRNVEKVLALLTRKYLCQVHELSIPISMFSYMHSLLEKRPWLAATSGIACSARLPQPGVAFTNLSKISIQIGSDFGDLSLSDDFANLRIPAIMCKVLKEVNLNVSLSNDGEVTCAGFRELVRYLADVTHESTTWNLTLQDFTTAGQVWYGPAQLNRQRNRSFICYVRALLELGITINRLELIDRLKISPYMLVMSNTKRRSIYMYPEFKNCRQLFVCYDIGMIAPIFSHENDHFDDLTFFEVDESHVLYKADLLEYLSNAKNLKDIRIVVPASWESRVSRCQRGCFSNPDFSCFKAEGWCSVPKKLPQARLSIVGATIPVCCEVAVAHV